MADSKDDDAPPPAAISAGTAAVRGRPFAPGQSGNPSGRPRASEEFRDKARRYAPMVLDKLYTLALKGTGMVQVRACEIIIERAFGKPALEISGPKGGPIGVQFHGAVRSAIEQLVAEAAAEAQAEEGDGPKN